MGRLGQLLIVCLSALPGSLNGVEWSSLDTYHHQVTRQQFEQAIAQVFCPSGALDPYLTVEETEVGIRSAPDPTAPTVARVQFAPKPLPEPTLPPLDQLHVALDPGHIGGAWARMEERYFVRGTDRPVMEGVLTLLVARHLKERLEADGVTVSLTRSSLEPVTDKRPRDFIDQARDWARRLGQWDGYPALEREAVMEDAAGQRAATLFYRNAEIRARAAHLNEDLRPDLTFAIHFNAVPWNDCHDLVDDNRLLFFVHGCYLPTEITDDQQRRRLFEKLLARTHQVEIPLAEAIAASFHERTGLAATSFDQVAVAVGHSGAVYARNLAANRLFDGPVVYLEPYFMNSRLVYQRLQAGDYDGEREINGRRYPSIFREYAEAVAAGLARYYATSTSRDAPSVDR